VTGFGVVSIVGVGMSAAAMALGLEALVGAFLAGVVVRDRVDDEAMRTFQTVTFGLFAPVFFATAGLRVDLSGLFGVEALLVAVLTFAVAVAGKFLGVAVGAIFTDLTRSEALCVAIGLNARGAVEIVIAALGLSIGILTPTMYAVVVVVAIGTSVIAPPLLRRALRSVPASSSATT
jgi:Kef-type K+ transport system membrane component KefB